MPKSSFFEPFQKPSKAEWENLLGDVTNRTISFSNSVEVPVFIHDQDALSPPPLTGKMDNNWNIVEIINVKDEEIANEQALSALEGGVDELLFILHKPIDWVALLKGIELSMIHLSIEVKFKETIPLMKSLGDFIFLTGWDVENLRGSWIVDLEGIDLPSYIEVGHTLFPNYSLFSFRQKNGIDQEIAFSKIFEELIGILEKTREISIIDKVRFRLIAEKNSLKTIAGIRAFKLLWLHFLKQQNLRLSFPDIAVILDTSEWHEDENKNRILATTQAMSAVIGGCNHLIIPQVSTEVDSFSARINRNISHIMKMESYMDRVVDPSAGSKVVEALTEAIALASFGLSADK